MGLRRRIDADKMRKAHKTLKCLLNQNTVRVLKVLDNSSEPLCVTDVERLHNAKSGQFQAQSSISVSLDRLHDCGLVKAAREGKKRYHWIDYDRVEKVNRIAGELASSFENTMLT